MIFIFKFNTLFFKLLILTLSIILIFATISYTYFSYIGEKLLLEQINNNTLTNLNFSAKYLEDYSIQVSNAMLKISNSKVFKDYITKDFESPIEYTNIVINLTNYIDNYKEYLSPENSHIIVSSMPNTNGRHYSSNSIKWDNLPQNIVSDYMTVDNKIPNRIIYNGSKDLFVLSSPYKNCIFATKPLIDTTTNNLYGYAMIVMDERNLYDKYSGYITKGVSIYVIKSDSTILSSNDTNSILTKNEELLKISKHTCNSKNNILVDNKNKIGYLSIYMPFFDSYLVEKIDYNIAFASFYNLHKYIIIITLLLILITSIIVFFIVKHITNPISNLVKTMKNSTSYKLYLHKVKSTDSTETKVLINTYNNLVTDLNTYVKRLLTEQDKRRKADLVALQRQINPHFLYNTLTSIKYLAHNGQISQVDNTIQSLILMLKATIGSLDETITLEKEIELLKNYTYINQIRFGEQICVNINMDEDCSHLIVPKLIIQPFVENAFFHAFPNKNSGLISIFIRKDLFLTIEIIDNGVGMPIKDLINIPKKSHFTGIGIHNVDERIKMLYGNDYGIEIFSEANLGTSIKIILPIISKD